MAYPTGGTTAPPEKKKPKKKPPVHGSTPPGHPSADKGKDKPAAATPPAVGPPGADTPYDPLQSLYPTFGDFNSAVTTRARSYYMPQIRAINEDKDFAERANRQRVADINKYWGGYGALLGAAYDTTKTGMKNIIDQSGALQREGDATIANLFQTGKDQANAQANIIGGGAPSTGPNLAPAANATAAGSQFSQGEQNALFGKALAYSDAAANRLPMAGIGAKDAAQRETGRFGGVMDAIQRRRAGVLAERGAFEQKARSELTNEEMQRQNVGFQQNLATKQFGETTRSNKANENLAAGELALKGKTLEAQMAQFYAQYGLDVKKFDWQKNMDQANLAIAQQQVENQVTALSEQGKEKEAGALAAQQAKGMELVNSYMTPRQGENLQKVLQRRSPQQLYRQLRTLGLSRANAIRLVRSAANVAKFKLFGRKLPDVNPFGPG